MKEDIHEIVLVAHCVHESQESGQIDTFFALTTFVWVVPAESKDWICPRLKRLNPLDVFEKKGKVNNEVDLRVLQTTWIEEVADQRDGVFQKCGAPAANTSQDEISGSGRNTFGLQVHRAENPRTWTCDAFWSHSPAGPMTVAWTPSRLPQWTKRITWRRQIQVPLGGHHQCAGKLDRVIRSDIDSRLYSQTVEALETSAQVLQE